MQCTEPLTPSSEKSHGQWQTLHLQNSHREVSDVQQWITTSYHVTTRLLSPSHLCYDIIWCHYCTLTSTAHVLWHHFDIIVTWWLTPPSSPSYLLDLSGIPRLAARVHCWSEVASPWLSISYWGLWLVHAMCTMSPVRGPDLLRGWPDIACTSTVKVTLWLDFIVRSN